MSSTTSSTVQRVDEALLKLNKGNDIKEEAMMTNGIYANWEEFLVPAPLSIACLGELILISGERDFSLEKNIPTDGFKVLRYPSSFRACLAQVSNAGWEAFNEAHTSMDQIRLQTANVDDHIKQSVKLLVGGSDAEVEIMLPKSLNRINQIAEDCLSVVTSVEEKFMSVMALTGELLEACTSAKGHYEQELKEAKCAVKVVQNHLKVVKEQKKRNEELCNEMTKEVEECKNSFNRAAESFPSGLEMIGMSLLDGITSKIAGTLNAIATAAVGRSPAEMDRNYQTNVYEYDESYNEPPSGQETKTQKANRKIYSRAEEILLQVTSLLSLVDTEQNSVPDTNELQGGKVNFVKASLEHIINDFQKQEKTPVQSVAMDLCSKSLKVCKDLQSFGKSMNPNAQEFKSIVTQIQDLHGDASTFQTQAKFATGSNPVTSKNPQASKIKPGNTQAGVIDAFLQTKRMEIENSKVLLQQAKQRQDEAWKALSEKNEKLGELLGELAKHEDKEINFDAIRKVLIKGLKALAEVREQWGKLVRFFSFLSNLIKHALGASLDTFVESAKSGRELKLAGMTLSETMRDVMYRGALKASIIAYQVNSISSTYVEISNNYLMDEVTCLGKIIALDPEEDRRAMRMEKQALLDKAMKAKGAIRNRIRKNKEEFRARVDGRIARIENELRDVLPPPKSRAELVQIEETKKAAKETVEKTVDVDQWV